MKKWLQSLSVRCEQALGVLLIAWQLLGLYGTLLGLYGVSPTSRQSKIEKKKSLEGRRSKNTKINPTAGRRRPKIEELKNKSHSRPSKTEDPKNLKIKSSIEKL